MKKPILCLDFDGVLHSYKSGWQGAGVVGDPPVPGAAEFIAKACEKFEVHIFSSRSNQPGGIDAMRGALVMWIMNAIDDRQEARHVIDQLKFPTEKPPAMVSIDDRAITFEGTWPDIETLSAFQPWNKRPPATTAILALEEPRHE